MPDMDELRESKVSPGLLKRCEAVWKLGGTNNFILKKNTTSAGRSGSTKKVMCFVTMPKGNSK